MIVPVPWQQLGVPREAARWPSRDLVHPCAAPPAASRVAQPAPDPSAPWSDLTPRYRTLSHRIISSLSAPGSRQLTTSPATWCRVIAPAEAAQRRQRPKLL